MAPHLSDAGNARLPQLLLKNGRALHGAEALLLIGRALWRKANDDGIVAMIDRLDIHDGFLARSAGVVTGPFSKGTLVSLIVF